MDIEYKKKLLDYLSEYVSQNKKEKINQVIGNRTRYITLLLQDIYQAHNASAVLRSADCFGIQNVHVVEEKNRLSVTDTIDRGASRWLDIIRYKTKEQAIIELKKQGYKIIATTPDTKNTVSLEDVSLTQKSVLAFGTEHAGLSDYILQHADEHMTIPMYGFTQSFNISVSAAITLYSLITKLHNSTVAWRLSSQEQLEIKLEWYKRIVRGSKGLEELFKKKLHEE